MERKIRIGILGCAGIAERSVIPALFALPQFELRVIASRNQDKAAQWGERYHCDAVAGYETLLLREDVDAVYVPLPTGLHHEWILKALRAGKHVLAEKSIAANYASACEMVSTAKENKLVLMENYMFQYHRQHQIVKNLLGEDVIGQVRLFRADFGFPALPFDNFRYDEEMGGGALLDAGGYTVRSLHFLLGSDFYVTSAHLHGLPHVNTNVYGSALLTSPRGIDAQLAFGMDCHYQCQYVLWGKKGKVTALRAFTPKPDFTPIILVETAGGTQEIASEPDNHFIGSLSEFYQTIITQTQEKHYQDILLQSSTLEAIRTKSNEENIM